MDSFLKLKSLIKQTPASFAEFSVHLPQSYSNPSYFSLLFLAVVHAAPSDFGLFFSLLHQRGICLFEDALIEDSRTLFHEICRHGRPEMLLWILDQPGIQQGACRADAKGRNGLWYSIKNAKSSEMVAILLKKHPYLVAFMIMQVHSQGSGKQGYLALAIQEQNPIVVQLLLKAGITHSYSPFSPSPFHQVILAHKKHNNVGVTTQIFTLLIQFGWEQDLLDCQGQTYLELCERIHALKAKDLRDIIQKAREESYDGKKDEGQAKDQEIEGRQEKLEELESVELPLPIPQQTQMEQAHSSNADESEHQDEESDEQFTSEENEANFQNQILELHQSYQSIQMQTLHQLTPFLNFMAQLAATFSLSLSYIGSFAYGLWLPYSDIDIALICNDGTQNRTEEILQKVFESVKGKGWEKRIMLNGKAKFRNVRMQMKDQYGGRIVEIFVFYRKNAGQKYVKYIGAAMEEYPQIAPLFYCLKSLLATFSLHSPKNHGLKSYALFLLLFSFLRHNEFISFSSFLMRFFHFYAFQFEYREWQGQGGGVQISLDLRDPLNWSNNMGGRDTDVKGLRQVWKVGYYALATGIRHLPQFMQLASIIL